MGHVNARAGGFRGTWMGQGPLTGGPRAAGATEHTGCANK